MSKKIIIDNDAGIDDAWAIFVAIYGSPEINVLALTCVNGNTSLDNVCRNNLRLLSVLKKSEIPVYLGARSQLITPEVKHVEITEDLEFFHGRNGFGDVDLPKDTYVPQPQEESAIHALYRITKEQPKEVTLVCCGPLTNIALAMKVYPDFVNNVKEVFIMGGSNTATGNTTRCAEFNFHTDPEAAYIVLKEMGEKVTILPWDTCVNVGIPFSWRDELGANGGAIVKFLNLIEARIIERGKKLGFKTYISCDQLLGAIVAQPDIVLEMTSLHASIELAGNHTRGQMVIDHLNNRKHNARIIKKIDVEKYKELLWSLRKL